MRQGIRAVHAGLLAGAIASSMLLAGCFFHHGPYSPWISVEEPRYEQWERSTHRDHKQFDTRADDEQREYWQWRSSHS
jgi:hypothetical protein